MVDVYADEGLTGTRTEKRVNFNRMMRDCERGRIDYILTKSVARFARNTVDSLKWVTESLLSCRIPVITGQYRISYK